MEDPEPKTGPPAGDRALWFVRVLFGLPLAALGGTVTLVFLIFVFHYVANRIGGGPPQADLAGLLAALAVLRRGPARIGKPAA